MKKYVFSAVVAGLLVPMAYAMDGGADPAVEVEAPAVEVEIDPVAVDPVAVDEVPVETVEVTVETDHIRFLGPPEQAPGVEDGVTVEIFTEVAEGTVEKEIAVDGELTLTEVELLDLASQSGIAVDDNGHPIVICHFGGAFRDGVDENGEPVVCTLEPVGGGAVDPNLVDLTSESGSPVDENGRPVILYSFGNLDGGELPQSAPVEGNVEVTAAEDSPIRTHGDIQPNFRGGITDRGAEALAASASVVVLNDDTDAPNPQLLNDEQRGAVRGLRADAESAKPRSGMSKLLSKFRKPKAEVTLASATTTDKTLSAKLAEVDRMRDTALRTGDQKMLAKADKLEQELRAKSGQATKIPTRTK